MTAQELNVIAKKIASTFWNLDLNIPVEISKTYKSSFGKMYFYEKSKKPVKIKIASFLIRNFSKSTVIAILAHEICHWALLKLGKPYRDKDKYFQKELEKFGIPKGDGVKLAGTFASFICTICNNKFEKLYMHKSVEHFKNTYKCRSCSSKLQLKNVIHVQDENIFNIEEAINL